MQLLVAPRCLQACDAAGRKGEDWALPEVNKPISIPSPPTTKVLYGCCFGVCEEQLSPHQGHSLLDTTRACAVPAAAGGTAVTHQCCTHPLTVPPTGGPTHLPQWLSFASSSFMEVKFTNTSVCFKWTIHLAHLQWCVLTTSVQLQNTVITPE